MQCTRPVSLPGKLTVPCGKCTACRIHRSREWAIRCLHELSYHKEACFLTLTYNNENLPEGGSIGKEELQKFFRRLRKSLAPRRIKYLACGEYGDQFGRPHYHAIIFGLGLDDSIFKLIEVTKKGVKVSMEEWTKGFVYGGSVTYESARYVAGYVQKKQTGASAIVYGDKERPFQLVSQGIGRNWCLDKVGYLMQDLSLTVNGQKMSIPRYYTKILGATISEERKEERKATKERELTEFLISSGYDPVKERSEYLREVRKTKEQELNQRVARWKPRSD